MANRHGKRKVGLVLLGLAILTPALAFGISNLFLVSPKGKAFLASRIERKLHLETNVQGASWSPWNGITIYGLRVEQPEQLKKAFTKPLLSVQSIRLHPDWLALVKRRLELKGIEVVKPDLTLPIELLSQIPRKDVDPALVAKPPDLASVNSANKQPQELKNPPEETGQQPPVPPTIAGIEEGSTEARIESVSELLPPTVWFNLIDARLRIVSLMRPAPLWEAIGINGSVPLAGKPSRSEISATRVSFLENPASGLTSIPLKWNSPVLALGSIKGEMFGLDFELGGHVGFTPGIPFRFDALVPEQTDSELRIDGQIEGKLGKVTARGRSQGHLLSPASWQGQGAVHVTAVDAEIPGQQKTRFDHGQALLLFQNGVLRCTDARLISEQASIIGNAMMLSDGRMAGIARLIAAPESLLAISKFTQPDSKAPHLTPLSTPQRAALDLQVFGRPGKLFYKPNPMADPVPLQ